MKTVTMIGVGEAGTPVRAEHTAEAVVFGTTLRDGQLAEVHAPHLTVAQARQWIRRRLAAFARYAAARESAEEAIRRKTIAAQGQQFGVLLKATLDAMGRMEYGMMFSPHSHAAGLDLATVRKGSPHQVRVTTAGTVTGLDPTLRDSDGLELAPDP